MRRGAVTSQSGVPTRPSARRAAPNGTISEVANTGLRHRALAWDPVAGNAVAAFVNDQGLLEIVRPDGGLYWGWTYQGPADGDVDLDLDPATGDARACFFRSGNLLVYGPQGPGTRRGVCGAGCTPERTGHRRCPRVQWRHGNVFR